MVKKKKKRRRASSSGNGECAFFEFVFSVFVLCLVLGAMILVLFCVFDGLRHAAYGKDFSDHEWHMKDQGHGYKDMCSMGERIVGYDTHTYHKEPCMAESYQDRHWGDKKYVLIECEKMR